PYGIIVLLRADPQWLRANLFQDLHERRNARFAGGGRGDRVALCNQCIRVSSEELFIRGGNSGKFLARHWVPAEEYRASSCSLKMLRRFFHDSLFRAARISESWKKRRSIFREQLEARYSSAGTQWRARNFPELPPRMKSSSEDTRMH